MNLLKFLWLIFYIAAIFSTGVHADVIMKSPLGTELRFSDKKTGPNYDRDAWEQLVFKNNKGVINLSIEGRYFVENGSKDFSPSGRYIVVDSVAGGYVDMFDGRGEQYVDKAYCSVVDMQTGCIISDWDGEACGYDWKKDSDELASSDEQDTETFDFLSFKPNINSLTKKLSSLNVEEVDGYLRCDYVSKDNINTYQKLIKENKSAKKVVEPYLIEFIDGSTQNASVIKKTFLYSLPDESSKTKAYLIEGDKIKVIQFSKNDQWINVGYVTSKGAPLIAWIKSDAIEM
ncbi:hypothetical protein [Siccibacter colletis]|uniref:hypothetical protein n=1 Tax=Siccibacter colletis TaxID=1505757 RepID=UPI0004E0C913|nr:hypothetical protein [Siccibacter colletis]